MLILTRRMGESLVIGDDVVLTVVEIRGDKVRLGIQTPVSTSVHRQEVWEAIHGPREEAISETGWDAGKDPQAMLAFLRDKASPRKLRLFAVACARRVEAGWNPDGRLDALGIAERFADGLEGTGALAEAHNRTYVLSFHLGPDGNKREAAGAAFGATLGDAAEAAVRAAHAAACAACGQPWSADNAPAAARRTQVRLLHCLFGNPLQPIGVGPGVLAWRDGLAVSVARRMYESGDFAELPVLADMLEDAGCGDARMLKHCRDAGPHARGCFVVDLLLGRA